MDIGGMLSRAWERFSADIGNNIVVFLVGALLTSFLGTLTLFIAAVPITAGLYKTFRRVADGGKAEFNDLFSEFSNFGRWFMAWLVIVVFSIAISIVVGILSLIGIGLLILPFIGLIMMWLLFFLFPLMLDRGMEAIPATKESISAVTSNLGVLIGPILITIVLYYAGGLALGLGILLTGPLALIMTWLIYNQFYGAVPASSFADAAEPIDPPPPPPPPPPPGEIL